MLCEMNVVCNAFWPIIGGGVKSLCKYGCVQRVDRLLPLFSNAFQELRRKSSISFDNQSVILPGAERIRASRLIDDPYKYLGEIPNVKLKTVYEVLNFGVKHSDNGDFLGTLSENSYKWIKYNEAIERTKHIGSALLNMGLKPSDESLVGVYAANRTEFALTFFACAGYSLVCVPVYETLGIDAVQFIINQASFSFVICNNNANAFKLLKVASQLPLLKTIITMDPPSPEVATAAKDAKINLLTFAEFEMSGKNNLKNTVLPQAEDLFCIAYTSGTTGRPKGVMLSHANIISCVASLVVGYGPAAVSKGSLLSYLPPAHIYEIMNLVISSYFGRKIGFYSGDIKRIFGDLKILSPTIVPLVPKLMNRLYAKALDDIKSQGDMQDLLKRGLLSKEKDLKDGNIKKDTFWDLKLFKGFQTDLGGSAHLIATTSAPISKEVMRFFRQGSGSFVFEAYGQTEVLGATMTLPYESDGGFVGPPLPCNHVKLTDVPEMGYFAKDDVGEICVKGLNVFKGYFKNPEATNECLDREGWHHTGDIGRWLANGTLEVIDRKKHIFKLSQGEFIAPEKIENVYSQSTLVAQIFVDGFSDKDYIVAIVIPDLALFLKWAETAKFKTEDKLELLKEREVRKAFLEELHKYGKGRDLQSFEQARNIFLSSEPLSVEAGLMTPTLKVKRNVARKHFDSVLRNLYEEEPLIPFSKEC